MVASRACFLVLSRLAAHLAYSWVAPDRFIRWTIMPSRMMKIRTPMFPWTLSPMTSNMVVTMAKPSKCVNRPAPTMMPISREKLTSFVIRLTMIASKGGTNAQKVAFILTFLS